MTTLPSLFSFAKFLELLLYSPAICTLSHTLCTHTSSSTPKTSLPASRFNVIRHFSYKSYRVSFTLSSVDDIFDLRMPRLQFAKSGWVEKSPPATASIIAMDELDKRELRQEIKHWWQAVADHLDKVVCLLPKNSQSLYLNLFVGGRVLRQRHPFYKESTSPTLR
jgi:1-phosphatidylinositol-3-phosphate 5-kinase